MIRRSLLVAAALLLACSAVAAHTPPRQADPAYLATIVDDDPHPPLPRGLAPGESPFGLAWLRGTTPPPTGYVRAQAEYEGNAGIFIRWGSFNALHTAMVVPLTTANPPSTVYVAVTSAAQQTSATTALQGGGANMAHVRFMIAATNSVWIRDYGPRFIENEGRRAIVDHTYNRPRPDDNNFPVVVANQWQEPLFDNGLIHGGGNFHLFRNREAFMTTLILNENPGLSLQTVLDRFTNYQGLDVTITQPFPQSYDSTQHIDMWMLPLGDDKVLIGEYAASEGGGVPRTVTEATVTDMIGRGYTVYRTPGWNVGGTHYTYANSVIVNQVALICRFNGYDTQNAQALAVYQSALPNHSIVQVDCSGIISLAGAIHCIVKHVPDLLFRDPFDDDL